MRYLNVKSKIWQLYLRGLRGHFENPHRYKYLTGTGLTIYIYGWIRHNLLQHEFDIRKQPNFLIQKFIYKARREHYIYWEQSRLARGLSTTFSYYDWDKSSEMVCYTNRKGEQKFEKNIFSRERLDIMDNPLFEEIFKAEVLDHKQKKRGGLLIAYELNRNNRYDLDNYLHYKPINPFDFVRAIYYSIYTILKLTNKYRYDHFLAKPDWLYEFEKLKIALNGMERDQYFARLLKL